jgi:hypothetical protein
MKSRLHEKVIFLQATGDAYGLCLDQHSESNPEMPEKSGAINRSAQHHRVERFYSSRDRGGGGSRALRM